MKPNLGLFCAAALMAIHASAQEVTLRGTIRDAVSHAPTPCTVTITDAKGRVVLDRDSLRTGFRCDGTFSRRLPAGHTRIRVTRGFETRAVEKEVDLVAGQEAELEVVLERLVNLRERGWYAGDSHVHMLHGERQIPVDFDFVALTARAEDLQYMSLAQAWIIDPPTPEALQKELGGRSIPTCMLTWNLEAPKNYYKGDAGRCLGHCWNVAVRGRTPEGQDVVQMLINASAWDYESSKPTFANFESHRLIHSQGGAVFYSHPARWWTGSWGGQGGYPKVDRMRVSNMAVELPLDTVVGPTFDGIDVITGPGEFEANAKAFEIWCLLLNHGYRLSASGSSDACFDRPGGAVPGVPRIYSYVPEDFSIPKAARAAAAGNTFVTTGPLLVAMLDGQPPGSSVKVDHHDHRLNLEAWPSGAEGTGLRRAVVLRNGKPFREFKLDGMSAVLRTNVAILETEDAWYCVRVFGKDEQRQQAISGAFYFQTKPYVPPAQARSAIHAVVVDGQSGKPLDAMLTEVVFDGTLARGGKTHPCKHGDARFSIPGSARLRADAPGHGSVTLSPFLDNPELVETITHLGDTDLLNWETYQRVHEKLASVELTFRLPSR